VTWYHTRRLAINIGTKEMRPGFIMWMQCDGSRQRLRQGQKRHPWMMRLRCGYFPSSFLMNIRVDVLHHVVVSEIHTNGLSIDKSLAFLSQRHFFQVSSQKVLSLFNKPVRSCQRNASVNRQRSSPGKPEAFLHHLRSNPRYI
jgi:hypothetical protein